MKFLRWLFGPSPAERRQSGYNYAAGQLLRGVEVEVVERQAIFASDFDEFDEGMLDAVRKWQDLHPIIKS